MIAGTPFVFVDAHAVWPAIERRLKRTRSDERTISALPMRCATGEAVCMQCPEGVLILTLRPQVEGTIVARVLLAVSNGLHGAFHRLEQEVLALARDMGADVLTFETDRRGWRRVLGPQWQEHDGVFSRAVNDPTNPAAAAE